VELESVVDRFLVLSLYIKLYIYAVMHKTFAKRFVL